MGIFNDKYLVPTYLGVALYKLSLCQKTLSVPSSLPLAGETQQKLVVSWTCANTKICELHVFVYSCLLYVRIPFKIEVYEDPSANKRSNLKFKADILNCFVGTIFDGGSIRA